MKMIFLIIISAWDNLLIYLLALSPKDKHERNFDFKKANDLQFSATIDNNGEEN